MTMQERPSPSKRENVPVARLGRPSSRRFRRRAWRGVPAGATGLFFWRTDMNDDFWVVTMVSFALVAGYSMGCAPEIELNPEIVADVAGVDLSRDTEVDNTATTETHIETAEGSDVTAVPFTFAGLSGGAAAVLVVLCALVKLFLTNRGQGVALHRVIEAIENAAGEARPEVDMNERSWRDGGHATRKGIKRRVADSSGDDKHCGPRDRAARIIDRHLDKIRD